MVNQESLPDFEFEASPRQPKCARCGAGPDGDLRFVILRGRTRYFGRTFCDLCTEAILEVFCEDITDEEPSSGTG